MKTLIKWFAIGTAVALLGACASGVNRLDGAQAMKLTDSKVKEINLSLTDSAKQLLSNNSNFDPDLLKAAIQKRLKSNGLLLDTATQSVEVVINSFRSRADFTAVVFGFMAGNDNILGEVTIKDAMGKQLRKAEVSASYALGGALGGRTEVRMNWLYDEFAKLVVSELTGEAKK